MLPPSGVLTANWIQTKFGRAGNLPNVITHAKFQSDWNKIVTLAKGWSFMFSTTEADAINTAKPYRAACEPKLNTNDFANQLTDDLIKSTRRVDPIEEVNQA